MANDLPFCQALVELNPFAETTANQFLQSFYQKKPGPVRSLLPFEINWAIIEEIQPPPGLPLRYRPQCNRQ